MDVSEADAAACAAHIVAGQRWAALATVDVHGAPLASQVAYAVNADGLSLILHLSELAAHTQNLLERQNASLTVTEPDDGRADPQTLARCALRGAVRSVAPGDECYDALRACYLTRIERAVERFEFADFRIFLLQIEAVHFVGGFARAFRPTPAELSGALRALMQYPG
ncbi:MAG: pyridoxamine 5'-phosphate oxidase [Chromatiales bacterium]|nr:pyridoxamine 5'-phosphate oxidase [Chromatiales bacterium]